MKADPRVAAVSADPTQAGLWPAALVAYAAAGRLEEGVQWLRWLLEDAGRSEALEAAFLQAIAGCGFGLGEPLEFLSPSAAFEHEGVLGVLAGRRLFVFDEGVARALAVDPGPFADLSLDWRGLRARGVRDGVLHVATYAEGEVTRERYPLPQLEEPACRGDVSPDGRWLVLQHGDERRLTLVERASGSQRRLEHAADLCGVELAWSRDGRFLATLAADEDWGDDAIRTPHDVATLSKRPEPFYCVYRLEDGVRLHRAGLGPVYGTDPRDYGLGDVGLFGWLQTRIRVGDASFDTKSGKPIAPGKRRPNLPRRLAVCRLQALTAVYGGERARVQGYGFEGGVDPLVHRCDVAHVVVLDGGRRVLTVDDRYRYQAGKHWVLWSWPEGQILARGVLESPAGTIEAGGQQVAIPWMRQLEGRLPDGSRLVARSRGVRRVAGEGSGPSLA